MSTRRGLGLAAFDARGAFVARGREERGDLLTHDLGRLSPSRALGLIRAAEVERMLVDILRSNRGGP